MVVEVVQGIEERVELRKKMRKHLSTISVFWFLKHWF